LLLAYVPAGLIHLRNTPEKTVHREVKAIKVLELLNSSKEFSQKLDFIPMKK
jgi:hypothetical protein